MNEGRALLLNCPSKDSDLEMAGVVRGDVKLGLVIGEKVDLVPANVMRRQVDRSS